jgi:SHS2 domain-containing protein
VPDSFPSASYEYLDHAADLGIRVRAPTLEQLFQSAGNALMNWIGPAPCAAEQEREIALSCEDLEDLMVRWLQELLYLFHQRHQYFSGTGRLEVTGTELQATLRLKPWDQATGETYQEVKAVTYHKLCISREPGGWVATVVVDI